MIPKRVELVPVTGLVSSYPKKRKPTERLPIEALGYAAMVTPDMNAALHELNKAVTEQNGTLYITDLLRTWDVQAKLRSDFESRKKKAYAAPPGGSFHQAGRAVDFSVRELNFEDVSEENWLKKFWDLAKPLGFKPIIKIPDLKMSECWHFDFIGKDWARLYDYADDFDNDKIDYGSVAKCCILDVGGWDPNETETKIKNMFIQAQLLRLGHFEIGAVDGVLGPKTLGALQSLKLAGSTDAIAAALSKR